MQHEEKVKHGDSGNQAIKGPVCGMSITAEAAFGKHEYGGRAFYFCSSRCLEKFRTEPSKYAK